MARLCMGIFGVAFPLESSAGQLRLEGQCFHGGINKVHVATQHTAIFFSGGRHRLFAASAAATGTTADIKSPADAALLVLTRKSEQWEAHGVRMNTARPRQG